MSDRAGRLARRELIRTCSLGTIAWASGAHVAAAQEEIRRTPTQVLGPFYPVLKPAAHDADLTLISGRTARAAGQMIDLTGRVINRRGRPVAGARIEIWQANTHGRYTHPSDRNPAPGEWVSSSHRQRGQVHAANRSLSA